MILGDKHDQGKVYLAKIFGEEAFEVFKKVRDFPKMQVVAVYKKKCNKKVLREYGKLFIFIFDFFSLNNFCCLTLTIFSSTYLSLSFWLSNPTQTIDKCLFLYSNAKSSAALGKHIKKILRGSSPSLILERNGISFTRL